MHRLSAKMTPDEFLAWERDQPTRHHYLRGEIFDMSGGSQRHNALSAELITALASALKGSPCRTFSADQKIGVAADTFVYPDVSVACAPIQHRTEAPDVVTNPVLIVEVLSKSTESYDRSDKLRDYLALSTVKHVLLVSQRAVRIDLYTRDERGEVKYETFGVGESIVLKHPKVTLSLDALYTGAFELPGDDTSA